VLERYANIALDNTTIYASTSSMTDPNKRIRPGTNRVGDTALAQANVFYHSATLLSAYTRSVTSGNGTCGGYDCFGGDWGNLPKVRFMFGQMEGKVWPYPTRGSELLSLPTNLRISSSAR
jgi:hypothetical protein